MPVMSGGPYLTDAKRAKQAARAERLALALRDNLRRRKLQARQRQTEKTGGGAADALSDSRKPPA